MRNYNFFVALIIHGHFYALAWFFYSALYGYLVYQEVEVEEPEMRLLIGSLQLCLALIFYIYFVLPKCRIRIRFACLVLSGMLLFTAAFTYLPIESFKINPLPLCCGFIAFGAFLFTRDMYTRYSKLLCLGMTEKEYQARRETGTTFTLKDSRLDGVGFWEKL